MITMANAGTPLHKSISSMIESGVRVEFVLHRAIGAFVSLLRAMVFLHSNSVFHCDVGTGNMLVDASGLGRFIDCGYVDFLGNTIMPGFDEHTFPAYDNPFDGFVFKHWRVVKRDSPSPTSDAYPNPLLTNLLFTGCHCPLPSCPLKK
jgi:serine/threonine protein kinase